MEAILERIRSVNAASIELITAQKNTIAELKTKLSEADAEYAAFLEEEGIEDAEAEAFLAQLGEISDALSAVVSEVSVEE